MANKRDYYEILGLGRNASSDDIKRTYRNLALKYHPDRVSADKKKEAEERFKEISEAYEVLMDPNKKAAYDQFGHAGVDSSFKAGGFDMGQDFHHFDDLRDIFGEMDLGDLLRSFGFGGDIFGGGFGFGGRHAGPRRGSDLEYKIEISFEDAAFGGKKTIAIPRYETCGTCGGTGAKPGSKQERCPACQGRGRVSSSSGFFNIVRTCDKCGGEGTFIRTLCQACNGKGRVRTKKEIEVNIPAGVDSGSRLRLHGQGEAGEKGGRHGDLYLVIYVRPHEIFERREFDIHCEVPVDFVTAALGGEIEVPMLEGRIKMKVPAGTQSGKVFRLRGKGIAHLADYGRGDQLVKVQVDVPSSLTQEQKRLLKEFQKASDKHPGPLEQSFMEKMKRIFK